MVLTLFPETFTEALKDPDVRPWLRAVLSAIAMNGIVSSLPESADYQAGVTARLAVEHADALLAELEKP